MNNTTAARERAAVQRTQDWWFNTTRTDQDQKRPKKKSTKLNCVTPALLQEAASVKDKGDGFTLLKGGPSPGVYLRLNGRQHLLCGPLEPLGSVLCDPIGGEATIQIRLQTRAAQNIVREVPHRLLGRHQQLAEQLVGFGLELNGQPSRKLGHALAEYLRRRLPNAVWLRLSRSGWNHLEGKAPGYAHGERFFSAGEPIKVLPVGSDGDRPVLKGEFAAWQKFTQHIAKDHLAVTTICAGLSSMLLHPLGTDPVVLTLAGRSSTGKSTALKLVAACFGPPDQMKTWNATANALEALVRQRSDAACVIDEVGQTDGATVAKVAYALTNSSGRLRATPNGQLRDSARSRAQVITAGELGPLEAIGRAKLQVFDGQVARLPTLRVDGPLGVWSTIEGFESAAEKSRHLAAQVEHCYGWAARTLCKHLAKEYARLSEMLGDTRARLHERLTQGVSIDKSDGVQARMLENFTLFAFAGLLAVDAKAVKWTRKDVVQAVGHCFRGWHADYLKHRPAKDADLLNVVKLFFQSNRHGKFMPFESYDEEHRGELAGYVHQVRGSGEDLFLVYPAYFQEVLCKGLDYKAVLKALKHLDLLKLSPRGGPTRSFHIPGPENLSRSFYAIKANILQL